MLNCFQIGIHFAASMGSLAMYVQLEGTASERPESHSNPAGNAVPENDRAENRSHRGLYGDIILEECS